MLHLEIQLPGTQPAAFDVIYPLQTLKPIAAQLRSRMQSDSVGAFMDRTFAKCSL